MTETVKPGYKQTAVGVIPEEWDVDFIENLAHIATGGKNTQDRIADGEYPFFVRSQIVERINSYSFDGEAVLTAGDGVGTGKVFHYINGKFDVHQRVYRISNFSERINGFYFFLYFSSHFYNRIMQMTAKSSVDSVRRDMIARMLVPLPPTEAEQHAIATALSDVDALIAKLDQLIAKKRDLKQAAMQQLLTGQTRLPGFSGEWEVRRLGDVATIQRGASPRPIDSPIWFDENSLIGWVRISDVTRSDMFLRDTTQRLSKLGVQHSRPVSSGSLIMSICATVGRPIITEIDACIHDGFVVFDHLRTDKYFMYYVLRFIEDEWTKYGQTGSQMNLNTGLINSTEIFLPPHNEQTAIATVLSDMDAEIAALEARRDKTRALKQGMMQELLTGRIRLI
jgi:type I restriction enzyme S subunit